jgi:hypothetical protein
LLNFQPFPEGYAAASQTRDLPPKETIEVQTTEIGYPKLTRTSMLKDFQNHPKGNAFYPQLEEASYVDIPFGEPRSFA